MNIIAVDDEVHSLGDLEESIREAVPDSELSCFSYPEDALLHAEKVTVNVAFIDIEMIGMNGLELAKKLKDINGKTNIIFATGYSEYAVDAFSVSASGYLLKPVSSKAVRQAMEQLRHPVTRSDQRVKVQTFGNFEVFIEKTPLYFPRRKAKELFAYLIHKKGTGIGLREISVVLFEDKTDNDSLLRQTQTIVSTMMKVLRDAGAKDTVIKQYNSLAVDISKVDCDYYRFLQGDAEAVNAYTGEYMTNYSWAEFTITYLDNKVSKGSIKQ